MRIFCTFLYFSACLQFVHVWDNKLVLDFTCLRGMDTWHQKVTRTHTYTSVTPSHEVKNHAAKSPEPWLPIDCLIAACGVTRTAGDKITIHTLLGRLSIGSQINLGIYYSGILICPQTMVFNCNVFTDTSDHDYVLTYSVPCVWRWWCNSAECQDLWRFKSQSWPTVNHLFIGPRQDPGQHIKHTQT